MYLFDYGWAFVVSCRIYLDEILCRVIIFSYRLRLYLKFPGCKIKFYKTFSDEVDDEEGLEEEEEEEEEEGEEGEEEVNWFFKPIK